MAASAIASLQITEPCYKDAIELLKKTFVCSFRVGQDHISKLRLIHCVHLSADDRGLRGLYDIVHSHIRGHEDLQVPSALYASMLIDILLRKSQLSIRSQKLCQIRRLHDDAVSGTALADNPKQHLLHDIRVEVKSCERSIRSVNFQVSKKRAWNWIKPKKVKPTVSALESIEDHESQVCFSCWAKSRAP